MSCDLCHKVTKFPIIIRREKEEEEVGINSKRQLCLNCFEKTPPSSFVPDDEKNTKEQKKHPADKRKKYEHVNLKLHQNHVNLHQLDVKEYRELRTPHRQQKL